MAFLLWLVVSGLIAGTIYALAVTVESLWKGGPS